MQSKAVFLLSTACICASAVAANAQIVLDSRQFPSRFSVGADFTISQPKGEFANNVPNGYGFDVTGLYRIDPAGWFSIRGDFGGDQYGHEHIDLGFLGFSRVPLDLDTNNRFAFGSLGLQLQIPGGWFRPYANASYAAVNFWTESCVSASDQSVQDTCHTNHGDWTSAGVFGGGLIIPFGKSLGALNLGAKYHYGGRATYLRKGDITDNPDGSVTLNVHESKTDLVLWQIGVTFAIPSPARH
jgi:hypothetical protein